MLLEGLWKITAILVALFLVVLIPLLHAYEAEDRFTRMRVLDEMDLFLEEVCSKGLISQGDYLDFEERLSKLGYSFDIDMKHYKKILVPIYDDPLNHGSFEGRVEEVEELFGFREIRASLFPEGPGASSKPYLMNKGDYIVLALKSDMKTKYQSLRRMLFLTEEGPAFRFNMARSIKNETY